MIFKFLKGLTGKSLESEIEAPIKSNKKRASGYRAKILSEHGFEIPPSNVDKNLLGIEFEKAGEIEKAIACYEGCIKNAFDGSHPYDRLMVIYRRLDRKSDEARILRQAISIYKKNALQGQCRADERVKKYESRLLKLEGSG